MLEDDPRRSNEMRRAIKNSCEWSVLFFDNAYGILSWLSENTHAATIASLDCDLDTTSVSNASDAGTGDNIVESWLTCLSEMLTDESA